AEPDDGLRVAVRRVGFLAPNDRREDCDALLALANEPSEFVPGVKTCHARRVGPLPRSLCPSASAALTWSSDSVVSFLSSSAFMMFLQSTVVRGSFAPEEPGSRRGGHPLGR